MSKCEYCGKEHDGSYGSGRFCSKSCAKGFSTKIARKEINRKLSEKNMGKRYIGNGVQINVGRSLTEQDIAKTCLYCGKPLIQAINRLGLKPCEIKKRIFCDSKCQRAYLHQIKVNKTLQSLVDTGQHPRVRFNGVRSDARKVLQKAGIEKKCCICGFDVVVEVHHIRAVTDFPFSATIAEVNDLSNLLYLCPNHHVMVDKGLISVEDLDKYRYQ